jgi:MoxR-like ATPase
MDTSTPTTSTSASTATATDRLRVCLDANIPALLMGAPGTAKTATIEALAAERGAYLEIVIASAQDPTTILGIPMPSADRRYTEPTTPGWARRINEAHAEGRPTILFLDELTTVPEHIAGPLLGVIQSRRADGWTLPADCRIVAAANPPDLAVGGWALAPAMANRWCHIDWPVPLAEWTAWARSQTSPTLQLVADFVTTIPEHLLSLPALSKRSGPWPSPRSWTNAARLVDASGDLTMAALAVGESVAATFAAWVALRDVPSVAELLDGSRSLPTRQDAFTTAVGALIDATRPDTLARTIEVLKDGVAIDAATIAQAAQTLTRAGFRAGIAGLVATIEAAGLNIDTMTEGLVQA